LCNKERNQHHDSDDCEVNAQRDQPVHRLARVLCECFIEERLIQLKKVLLRRRTANI